MKTDEMKRAFIRILKLKLDADQDSGDDKFPVVILNDGVLEENGLSTRTFWSIVCPMLKKDGLLEWYSDPDNMTSDFAIYATKKYSTIESLSNYSYKNFEDLKDILRKKFDHRFLVVRQKLLQWKDEDKAENNKQKVVIDSQKGIYLESNPNNPYDISGKRLKIVEYLLSNNNASLSDLAIETSQGDSVISAAIKKINENCNGIGIEHKLIEHSKTSNYRLNKDKLNIISA